MTTLPTPYYEEDGITLYCGDCRDILPLLPEKSVDLVLTDPPYPNGEGYFSDDIEAARQVVEQIRDTEAMIFWSELEHPPCRVPIVAVHIWHRTNVNGKIYEPIYHFHPDGIKRRSDIKRAAAVFGGVGPGCDQYAGHPTQKNIYTMTWLIEKSSAVGILDPFCGSGTTLVAAKRLGRKAIGIEISEAYCKIAVDRLRQMELFAPPPTTDKEA